MPSPSEVLQRFEEEATAAFRRTASVNDPEASLGCLANIEAVRTINGCREAFEGWIFPVGCA